MQKIAEIQWLTTRVSHMKLSRNLLIVFTVAGLLPPLFLRVIAWYQGEVLSQGWDFYKTLLVSVITTVTISCGVVSVMIWLQKNYPWRDGIMKRLSLELVLTTLTSCTLIVLITIVLLPIVPHEDLRSSLFNYLVIAVIMNFVLVSITEGIFFFRQWRNSAFEAERFKKESIRAQYESLKNQVNPHFLFNSLNTLSSLIDLDKESSKEFLDDLSSVYRYVLQHKDEEIVLLEKEMEFIYSFVELLKKRHGKGVAFHFNVRPEDLKKGIPPMSLQLLVENAVKHNIASRKKPLKVKVFSQGEWLVIRNNLQKKKNVISTGLGLPNIQNRYNFLIDQEIEIFEDSKIFEVKIPLIQFAKNATL